MAKIIEFDTEARSKGYRVNTLANAVKVTGPKRRNVVMINLMEPHEQRKMVCRSKEIELEDKFEIWCSNG